MRSPVKLKILKLALSKAVDYHALGVDRRTMCKLLIEKVSLLVQSTFTLMKVFALHCSCFANTVDYIVKAKSLLSSFIINEEVKMLIIVQRLKEL